MSKPKNTLPLTNPERLTDKSFEIVRLWVDHQGGSTAWIASNVLPDPRAFGRLIADTVQHGALAYAAGAGNEDKALEAILSGFDETMRSQAPTIILPGRAKNDAA